MSDLSEENTSAFCFLQSFLAILEVTKPRNEATLTHNEVLILSGCRVGVSIFEASTYWGEFSSVNKCCYDLVQKHVSLCVHSWCYFTVTHAQCKNYSVRTTSKWYSIHIPVHWTCEYYEKHCTVLLWITQGLFQLTAHSFCTLAWYINCSHSESITSLTSH